MQKPRSSLPGFENFPGRDLKLKTPFTFLEARRKIDGAEGLWRVRNNLYDLRGFEKFHPGGAEWIHLTRGTDITELFESHHLTDKAEKLLPKYFIREAVTPRRMELTFKPDGFFLTFKRRALEALKDIDFHHSSSKTNLIADFLLTSTILFSIATAYTQSYLILTLAGVFLAWTAIIGHNYFHMRDSFRMYYFDLIGISSKDWRISHAMSHHVYPNTLWDFEVYVLEPYLHWLPAIKRSMLTNLISAIMSPVIWALGGFEQLFKRYYSVFFEYKKFEFRDAVPFILPVLMSFFAPSVLVAVKFWLLVLCVGGFVLFMVGLNAAHHHPDIFHDGDIYRGDLDWGILELDAVRDRHVIDNSDFLTLTNFGQHALHHLLPTVDHSYLPLCTKAFEDTCREFGISTQKFTQWQLAAGQFRQILRTKPRKNGRLITK
ncbi:unnamed protein product [Xylocopa violacea]|uniref:Cytochrome b5 heme-binding domain-containing protein n=1 Tax=Xylocopa violacea TaxID=135666 RepID=A0ABP1N1V1_XYLVO